MRYALLTLLKLILSTVLLSQDWVVPPERAGRLSTFPFNDDTRKAGEKIYTVNCISCHGNPGKGNYISLIPSPGDPATEKIQKNRDGELFYKVTSGKGQMPSFRSVLSADEIWYVISYIRSFNSSYKQEIMPVITSSAYPGAEIRIRFSFIPGDTIITLAAEAVKGGQILPVTDAAVKLFVARTFGVMQIDEERYTGKEGLAHFRIPVDLPGDTAGNIKLSARFTDEEAFGSASEDTIIQAAPKLRPVSLVAERAMWNNVRKAPVWVILTYTSGMLLVWGFIMLVLLKLRDIYFVGKSASSPEKVEKAMPDN